MAHQQAYGQQYIIFDSQRALFHA